MNTGMKSGHQTEKSLRFVVVIPQGADPRGLAEWLRRCMSSLGLLPATHRSSLTEPLLGGSERVKTRWHNPPRRGCPCATLVYSNAGGGSGASSKPWSSDMMITVYRTGLPSETFMEHAESKARRDSSKRILFC